LATILLLGILLFNWVGYQLLTAMMEDKANRLLDSELDSNQYDESQLVSVKVPAIHFGYYVNSMEFERVEGQMEMGGISYNYVKRRLYHDSLELLCIPNTVAMQLNRAKNEFFKLVNDLQHPGQSKKTDSHSGKIYSTDNCTLVNQVKLVDHYRLLRRGTRHYPVRLSSVPLSVIGQPPDRAG
jgi:hypothetical protein